ncbi:trans-homoaconitate synthase [compost metagenome]
MLGKHSGSGGVAHVLEQRGLEISADTAGRLLEKVREYAEARKSNVPEVMLIQWLMEEQQRAQNVV